MVARRGFRKLGGDAPPIAEETANKASETETETISGASPPNGTETETTPADDPVACGREAWKRVSEEQVRGKERAGKEWADWLLIGAALLVGRQESLKNADAAQPKGKTYNQAFGNWLQHNGFEGIDKSDRAKLMQITEDWDRLTDWYAALPETDRLRWHHPVTLWRRLKCKDRPSPWNCAQSASTEKEAPKEQPRSSGNVLKAANKATGLAKELLRVWSEKFPLDDRTDESVGQGVQDFVPSIDETIDAWKEARKYFFELAARQSAQIVLEGTRRVRDSKEAA